MAGRKPAMLTVRDLRAGYGAGDVLHGATFDVRPGEIVALLGRNGAGRSTAVKALMGLLPAARGRAAWRGHDLLGRPTFEIARRGVGWVPESRDVFPTLTVRQNLRLGVQRGRAAPWTPDDLLAAFPLLAARRDAPAGVLSGGERQLLALARALAGGPDLLLADEPTEGLAPQLVARVANVLADLRRRGAAVLLVEQKLAIALDLADRCLVMGRGRIVFDGTPRALHDDAAVRGEWLAA